ncbi:hypothetical protein H0H87_000102 [Tephrocybe sp. NHM501043]|nr:hypothetical protein H0H87_000102 [Tephrocybe sp. NHM501043]
MATSFTSLRPVMRGCRNSLGRTGFVPSSTFPHNRSRFFSSAIHFRRSPVGPQWQKSSPPRVLFAVTAVGLGLAANISTIKCDALEPEETYLPPLNNQAPKDFPPPPQSSVSLYRLSFGTVSGICAGIFIKKGAKAAAWLLGGIFVLLQYLSSASVVRVDWGRVATRFENAFHTRDASGVTMGRRAKHKQSAPEPLDKKTYPTTKKLGKRKADNDSDTEEPKANQRPTKKAKDLKSKAVASVSKPSTKNTGKLSKKQTKPSFQPDSDNDSGDGWEDVASENDMDQDEFSDVKEFSGNLDDLMDEDDDDPLRGTTQKFDFDTEDEEEETQPIPKRKKSKQSERPAKIIPTASDASDSDDSSEDKDGRVTMANMEARSRALDAKAAAEAELDENEFQGAAASDEEDLDVEGESDAEGEIDVEPFQLPTTSEREAEKQSGGPDVHVVQRRMRQCVRVLGKFKRLAEKGRARSEYTDQLVADIASYYGYNEFLAEKLFQLFPVAEAIEFFEANEVSRPVTIRTNTLRTRRRDLAQALVNRGVNLEPIGKWTNVGLQVFESSVPIGMSNVKITSN